VSRPLTPPIVKMDKLCPRLHPYTIEKEFNANTSVLNDVIVLDGIDLLDHPPRFRIRTHDLHGPLPDIVVEDTGDRLQAFDAISAQTGMLSAVMKIRDDLAAGYQGCEFLPPTHTDEGVVVGMPFEGRTILAEDRILSVAYHKLVTEAIRLLP